MSCVVAHIKDGTAYMASDSLITDGSDKWRLNIPKFIKLNNGVYFGWAGNCRFGQIATGYPLINQFPELKDVVEWVTTVGEAAKKIKEDMRFEGLIVTPLQIYSFIDDLYVTPESTNYSAIGSGRGIALGVMYALTGIEMDGLDKVKIAVEAAAEWNTSVGGKVFRVKF